MTTRFDLKLKPFLLLSFSIVIFSTANAQKDSSGIYNTVSNYEHHQLSYAINYKTEKHKINDDVIFNNKEIKVTHSGVKHTLLKNNTYGYRSTEGQDYRFIENKEYKILNSGDPLILYTYQNPSKAPKQSYAYPTEYFFSINAASIPQPLTKANLKAAFPKNHHFHDELDSQMQEDKDLSSFDNFHNTYKIVRILKNSKA